MDRLEVINARTAQVQTLVFGHDAAVPRWSPDGTRLAYLARPSATQGHQLFVRVANRRAEQMTHLHGDVIDAAWSPDGRWIAVVAADPERASTFFYAGDNDYTASAPTPTRSSLDPLGERWRGTTADERFVDDRADRSRRHLFATDGVVARR